jgi:hypothetical protein
LEKPNKKKEPSQTEKTEPNRKKLSQTGLNWFFPQNNRAKLKPVGLNRFWFLFLKKGFGYFFFNKNRTESKMITPGDSCMTRYD